MMMKIPAMKSDDQRLRAEANRQADYSGAGDEGSQVQTQFPQRAIMKSQGVDAATPARLAQHGSERHKRAGVTGRPDPWIFWNLTLCPPPQTCQPDGSMTRTSTSAADSSRWSGFRRSG